jgi:hypothetical protein
MAVMGNYLSASRIAPDYRFAAAFWGIFPLAVAGVAWFSPTLKPMLLLVTFLYTPTAKLLTQTGDLLNMFS